MISTYTYKNEILVRGGSVMKNLSIRSLYLIHFFCSLSLKTIDSIIDWRNRR